MKGKKHKQNHNHNDDNIKQHDDNVDDKKVKHYIYCTNCGGTGHEYKICNEPVISLGVILVRFGLRDNSVIFIDRYKALNDNQYNDNNRIVIGNTSIRAEKESDLFVLNTVYNSIEFLMIRRKHTLGYIEFIRGRYKLENVDGIIFLFQQMTKEEIRNIGTQEFDELWHTFWCDDADKIKSFEQDYKKSKYNFERLKNAPGDINLQFYVNYITPAWDQPEWGFPKGRRNKNETDYDCAIREFREETGLKPCDFKVLDTVEPIVEEFFGTNGTRYRHIYYIAVSLIDDGERLVLNSLNNEQRGEIGDIGFYNYNDAINLIRPYHIERRKMIYNTYSFFINNIQKMIY